MTARGTRIVAIRLHTTDVLVRVADDVFDGPIDAGALADFLEGPDHALIVAVAGDEVVGQIRGVVHRQPDRARELYIDNLGVAPAFQRRGVARALVAALGSWAGAQGCTTYWLATEIDNAQALAFYRSLGAEPVTVAYLEGPLPAQSKR